MSAGAFRRPLKNLSDTKPDEAVPTIPQMALIAINVLAWVNE